MTKIIRLRPSLETTKLVEEFLGELEFSGKSRHTVINYRSDLLHFFSQVNSPLSKITGDVIKEYFQNLGDKSLSTRARKQASLHSFFDWCVRSENSPWQSHGASKG